MELGVEKDKFVKMEDKTRFLNELRSYVAVKYKEMEDITSRLGWNYANLKNIMENKREIAHCPINPEHTMPVQSLDWHVERCEKKYGTIPEVNLTVLSTVCCYRIVICSLNINIRYNNKKFVKNVGNVSKNADEKYTVKQDLELTEKEKSAKAKCLRELLEAERDSKRRRAAHRGKKVHTYNKTYNEVLREVIASQMERLTGEETDNQREEMPMTDEKKDKPSHYIGIGKSGYSGNPYKRWQKIEKEEEEMIKSLEEKNEKSTSDRYKEKRHHSSHRSHKSSSKRKARDSSEESIVHKKRSHKEKHKKKKHKKRSHSR